MQGLAEVLACLGFAVRPPQEGHEALARMATRSAAGQIGEQAAQLAAVEINDALWPLEARLAK